MAVPRFLSASHGGRMYSYPHFTENSPRCKWTFTNIYKISRVVHLLQHQALGGGRFPCCGALTGLQNIHHTLGGALAQPHLQQGTGQNAHHVVQEAIPPVNEGQITSTHLDPDVENFPHRGLFEAAVSTKGAEVVLPGEVPGGPLHG